MSIPAYAYDTILKRGLYRFRFGCARPRKAYTLLVRHAEVAVTPAALDNNSVGRVPSHSKMADLLGSILNSMEKPPTVGDQESRRKARGIKRMAK